MGRCNETDHCYFTLLLDMRHENALACAFLGQIVLGMCLATAEGAAQGSYSMWRKISVS